VISSLNVDPTGLQFVQDTSAKPRSVTVRRAREAGGQHVRAAVEIVSSRPSGSRRTVRSASS
jgi:hypothetical protein